MYGHEFWRFKPPMKGQILGKLKELNLCYVKPDNFQLKIWKLKIIEGSIQNYYVY